MTLPVLAAIVAATISGAGFAEPDALSVPLAPRSTQARVAPDSCRSAARAIRYYKKLTYQWQRERATLTGDSRLADRVRWPNCRRARLAAEEWRDRSTNARRSYWRLVAYHYDWRAWMPAKHQRVAQCETGYQGGTGPGGSRWDWDSGTYVSAFGIYRAGYDDDAHRIGNLGWDETLRVLGRYPTPREQMQVADSHRAAHGGWSGWGCRGA